MADESLSAAKAAKNDEFYTVRSFNHFAKLITYAENDFNIEQKATRQNRVILLIKNEHNEIEEQ